jgi:sucrose-6-phosphate hydrolase SacC (GH32 family)
MVVAGSHEKANLLANVPHATPPLSSRSGWGSTAVGAAFSDDGVTWERYAGNPLTPPGDAQGGMQPWVSHVAGFWYLFTTHPNWTGVTIRRSLDGLTNWKVVENNLESPDGKHTFFGNRVLWQEKNLWYLLQEVGDMHGGIWEIFLYTSPDLGNWTVARGGLPYAELQRAKGSMYGGPSFETVNGQVVSRNESGHYNLYYHAGSDGNLPTDIYWASSTDVLNGNWTLEDSGKPILMHTGDKSKFDYDQVADPSRVDDMIFFDGDNNKKATCAIGLSRHHSNRN